MRFSPIFLVIALPIIVFCSNEALAGEVNIKKVTLLRMLRGWALDVEIEHEDMNWRHYANWIQVETAHEQKSKRLIRRDIVKPTKKGKERQVYRVYIRTLPKGCTKIRVRGHCNVHSYGGDDLEIELKNQKGDRYEVKKQEINWQKYQFFKGEDDFLRMPKMRPMVHKNPPFERDDLGRVR